MEPVPVGVYGELYIGGGALARGYMGRAELTAERYVPHALSEREGERLYRTGDVVRWVRGGRMEFVGRRDEQVKVRGFRVEPGEIATVLKHHRAIRDAAAVVVERGEGDNRIVAYVVFKEHARRPEPRILRHYMKERLPAYMVPSVCIAVEQLTLTPNGKIDRKALPEPDWADMDLRKQYVAPTGTTQLRLQQIWENVFEIHPIGVADDFFELGGHSLLAVRLMSAIHKHFGVDLPLSTLFQGATIERLETFIQNREGSGDVSPLVGMQLGGSKRPFFCAHGIGGNIVAYQELARMLGPDQVFYGLQTPILEFAHKFKTLEEMVANYVEEIRNVQPEGPYLLGGWSMGGVIAFEMANQLSAQGQEVGLLAVMDVRPPVDESEAEELDGDLIKMALEFTIESFNLSLDLFASDWDHIMGLEADERLRFILEKGQAAKVLHKDLGLLQVRRLYDLINVNFRLLRDYKPSAYPGEIVLFKARNGEFENEVEDFRAAWDALADGGVKMHVIPSTHFQMLSTPHVEHLAGLLHGYFDEAERLHRLKADQPYEDALLVAR
jgi:thioesterase domain-containing protein/acyl carrier protein